MEDIVECPVCFTKLGVIDSRPSGGMVFRRRKCPKCGRRYGTAEMILPHNVGRHQVSKWFANNDFTTQLLRQIGSMTRPFADLDPPNIKP